MFVIGVLFTLALGPFFGVQIVEATQDEDLYVNMTSSHYSPPGWQSLTCQVSGVPSAIFFLCSLLMSVCRGRQRREVSRLWVLAGMVWVICGWIVWLRKDFTEKPLQWLIVAAVREKYSQHLILFSLLFPYQIQSVAFALFGLPVFLTDPFIWIYWSWLLSSTPRKENLKSCLSCKTYLLFVQSDAVKLRYEYVAVDIYL